jgi:4-hydroxy-tetrahydrodipicolinate synthase
MATSLAGTWTALVTPFKPDGAIDWGAYEALVEAQIRGGITGVVPCGTTGESPTLDREEQIELVKRAVSVSKGRAKVLAGTGTNSTRSTISASQAAEKAGADGVMIVVPYYNKPTQPGMLEHFRAAAAAVSCPVVVYNIPGRTGIDLAPETLARLCEVSPNVVATKEATGNVLRAQELVRRLGDRLEVLSGDDGLTLAMIAVGARGVISVTTNLYPAEVVRVTQLALEGKFDEARRLHLPLCPVHEIMFVEANPAPAKGALAHRGVMQAHVRGPLAPLSEGAKARVLEVLATYEAARG